MSSPIFLDPGSADLLVDWEAAAVTTVALIRAEAGREPRDRALRELIGELSTLSTRLRTQWAAHPLRIRHHGIKRLQHPDVGRLELAYRSMDLPLSDRAVYDLTVYTAEPGTSSPVGDRRGGLPRMAYGAPGEVDGACGYAPPASGQGREA
ncbi:hypothetical protein QF034_007466 [Streptomyces africanus]|uniref:MmyB-like transcription regulator ligand binding domain-containing protein n=1 Tax=Streptomyces africanus TaxID=231024 RepID=A0ABU0R1S4_9ACTN|nr:DNA-binding protein [Streptomyces africanus]MDQ0753235.1 hypothetical protein [Streptomyces africanus]